MNSRPPWSRLRWHPARQADGLAGIGSAQLAAGVGAIGMHGKRPPVPMEREARCLAEKRRRGRRRKVLARSRFDERRATRGSRDVVATECRDRGGGDVAILLLVASSGLCCFRFQCPGAFHGPQIRGPSSVSCSSRCPCPACAAPQISLRTFTLKPSPLAPPRRLLLPRSRLDLFVDVLDAFDD